MNRNRQLVRHLIEVAKDGARFYDDALRHVDDPNLRATFEEMAVAKRELITGLSARLRSDGVAPPMHGTVTGAVHKVCTDVAARLSPHREAQIYVAQLERVEQRLVDEVRGAITDTDDPMVRHTLEAYWPRVAQSRTCMRELKHSMMALAA
ncbi:PA2169 family four-helix-bundle protein [Solimonas marina]|uniref:PA2169 family four-helix-bundle protein n=1 Tax=Solimonas marina TaxID=2714601 RepID=A0A969W6Y6_9GAMM|nr:PA2169 family four-helix-bundle protein [Solimonas marina]NKF21806.1 PA2169 family four-helix-bundle protein [Solimonas marina]